MIDWLLGGAPGADGVLQWTRAGPVATLAVAVAALAWVFAWWSGRDAARSRVGELALWAAALGLLAAALAGAAWVEEHGRLEPGRRAVLVDGSASMAVVEGGVARGDAVAEILARLPDDADVFTFDDELRAGPPEAFTGRGTNLGAALTALSDRFLGQKLRGVVVITDGLDRGGLRRQLQEDPTAAPPALPGPLTVYQVGEVGDLRDTAIEDVVTGGFAFLRTPFELTAKLRGPPHATLPVTLAREGRLAATAEVTLDAAGRGEVGFRVTPTEVGRFAWEISTPVAADDAVPGNNAYPVVVRVVRDRTRVLQVCGSPSYDQKFLRLFLKEDPSVDLVSFFILRTTDDMGAGWASYELSLIAFPYEHLFTEDLSTFDLVILQNFDYKPYFGFEAGALLENIAQYVEEGGALVMTGGDRSFDLAGYARTPIERVLPVHLGLETARTDEAPFSPVISRGGAAHPITRLAGDPDDSRAVWERLPALDGLNRTAGARDDAAVLLEHPQLRGPDGEPEPVLAVREVGEGRSMALMVDASWRWSFSEAATGRGNQAYLRFWKNALRWLVADPADRRVVVAPSRENVLLGDEVRLIIKVRDPGYAPVPGAEAAVTVEEPGGATQRFDVTTDAAGEATVVYEARTRGAHRVHATAGAGAGDRGETVFAVSNRDPELVEIAPDGAFLADLAERAGGALRPPGDRSAPLIDEDAGREVQERREIDLATSPVVALLLGQLASPARFLRRRAGAR